MSHNLYNPDYLKQLCRKYKLIPSRKYGQNFLIYPVKSPQGGVVAKGDQFNRVNPEPIEKMIEAAEISPNDVVIEIGPGFGALTFELAKKAKKVIAFEIEKKLQMYWNEEIKKLGNLEIVWGNVLRSDPTLTLPLKREGIANPPLFKEGAGGGHYKVVANLPYQITSNVIRKFLSRSERDPAVAGEAENKPEVMVLMVQKEVAERICAKPGDMSVLSVAVQYYAEPEITAYIPRTYFWPVPAVDSAVIKIVTRSDPTLTLPLKREGIASPLITLGRQGSPTPLFLRRGQGEVTRGEVNDKDFFKLVKIGFAQKRKFLVKNLEGTYGKEKIRSAFQKIGLLPTARAQELSLTQWKELSTLL